MRERSFSCVLESLLLLSLAELGLFVFALFLNCWTGSSVGLGHSVSVGPLLSGSATPGRYLTLLTAGAVYLNNFPLLLWPAVWQVPCSSSNPGNHLLLANSWDLCRDKDHVGDIEMGWLLFNHVAQQLKWHFSLLSWSRHHICREPCLYGLDLSATFPSSCCCSLCLFLTSL